MNNYVRASSSLVLGTRNPVRGNSDGIFLFPCPHRVRNFMEKGSDFSLPERQNQIIFVNLFLFHLQYIAILDEFPGQRSRHSVSPPAFDRVGAESRCALTFGSCESRDFRTRKNPSVDRLSTAVSILPHVPVLVYKGQRSILH